MKYEKCVHTEHCCKKHGCKYGNEDCPVELGQKPQSFPCEDCEWDVTEPDSIERKPMIVQYVRDANKRPVAVVVAVGRKQVGFAFAHPKRPLNKALLIQIAAGRAKHYSVPKNWPDRQIEILADDGVNTTVKADLIFEVAKVVERVRDRANRYFKEEQV